MPEICYVPKKFSQGSLDIIAHAQAICEQYQTQGLTLTLRQIFYQFVSRDLFANKQTNYDRLGSILNDARLAGMLDWSYMEDRTRFLRSTSFWGSPAQIIESAARSYNRDLWRDQPYALFVFIEKDALVGVIERVCQTNRISFTSCRGYFSQSEAWNMAQSFGALLETGKKVRVLHLGDHDPSGIDMTRDLRDRFALFTGTDVWRYIDVRRIALNMHQVEQYDPPPNPAKLTDSRATDYIAEFGESSWELDALEPSVIATLIQNEVDRVRDPELWRDAAETESRERYELSRVSDHYGDVIDFMRSREWLARD